MLSAIQMSLPILLYYLEEKLSVFRISVLNKYSLFEDIYYLDMSVKRGFTAYLYIILDQSPFHHTVYVCSDNANLIMKTDLNVIYLL